MHDFKFVRHPPPQNSSNMVLDVDQVLQHINELGPYQWRILLMFTFIFFPCTYQTLIMTFVAYEPSWQCSVNATSCLVGNSSINDIYNTSTANKWMYERRCKLNRSDWRYADSSLYEGPHNTIVTEFDLVCDKHFLAWLANSILYFGWAFGAIILGAIADKKGRRSVLFPSVFMIIVFTFGMSFAHRLWLVVFCRFFVGFFEGGAGLSMFVLSTELVGPKRRAFAATLVWFYFSAALMIMGLKAFFIRDWRLLVIVCSIPWIFVMVFYKWVPESVRWLLVSGRKEEARAILEHAARVNKKEMPKDDLLVPVVPESSKGCLDLLSTKAMTVSTLFQCFAWFSNGMVYYGVSLSAGAFGGSIYLNFILSSLVEIPANVLVIDNCNRFGRKKTTIWYFVIGAVACVAVALIPSGTNDIGLTVGRVFCGTLGKLAITVSFNSIYVWSAELFPTMIRNSGMGLMSVVSRVGAAASPFLVQSDRIHPILPFGIMGASALVSAVLCWFLPETRGRPTSEVTGDVEVKASQEVIRYDAETGEVLVKDDDVELSDEKSSGEINLALDQGGHEEENGGTTPTGKDDNTDETTFL